MPRLFYALWPDTPTRAALAAAAASIDVRAARRVATDNLHLTLTFLGAVDETTTAALCAAPAPRLSAFRLEFGLCGWWRGSHVAWLAPLTTPAALLGLQRWTEQVAQAAGLATEARTFRPHVTVARSVTRVPRTWGALELTWQVTDFTLVESRSEAVGTAYAVRARWPLAPAGRDETGPASMQ